MKYLGSYFGSMTAVLLAVGAIICVSLLSTTSAVEVDECQNDEGLPWRDTVIPPGSEFDPSEKKITYWDFDQVDMPHCTKKPCEVYSGVSQPINMKFTPRQDMAAAFSVVFYEREYELIKHEPKYFVNVCDKIFWKNGTKSGCPLVADGTYVYKDEVKLVDDRTHGRRTFHWDIRTISLDGKISRGPCFELTVYMDYMKPRTVQPINDS